MRKHKVLYNLLIYFFLCILTIFFIFPIVLAAINSLKTEGEMFTNVLAFPVSPHWENYFHVLIEVNLINNFKNNVIITFLSVAGIIICSSLAGYKLSRTPGKLSTIIYFMFMASMLIPFYTIMFPLIKVAMALKIKGSIYGLPLIYTGIGVNFAVFLYHGFVKRIPREIEEAACIDGCGQLKTFTAVVFPLLASINMTIAILDTLWVWNDFLLPLVIINKYQNYTLVLVASSFFGKYTTEWSYILTTLILTSLPVIVFYLIFQKYIVKGITSGAVKG